MRIGPNLKKEIKEFIDMMGFNLLNSPEVEEEDGRFFITIFVDEPKKLIGERGVNLQTIQTIFRMMVAKKHGPDFRVDLDINGYKKRRSEFLREIAFSIRKKALRETKSIELEPMNSFDRRIIHVTLEEFEDVTTESIGEYPERRVVVNISK